MSAPAAPRQQRVTLVALLVLVTMAFGAVVLPFFAAVMWAVIIALLFTPMQRWLLARWGGRANLAALATLAFVVVIVILPLLTMASQLLHEGARAVERLRAGELDLAGHFQRLLAALPAPLADWLRSLGLGDLASLQQRLSEGLGRASKVFATQVLQIGQDTLQVVVGFFLMLYLAFFLLRDGGTLVEQVQRAIPLGRADQRELADKFSAVVRATVKGNLAVALLQGLLGGLAFWVLGLYGPLLWGTVMAVLSLLPAVGAALVWGPAALYLLATGAVVQGLGLIAYGVLVIGLVDNLLRPVLVGKDTRLPDWLVLLSTLGGMALFGVNGFVIGPVIAAMFVAVWGLYAARRHDVG